MNAKLNLVHPQKISFTPQVLFISALNGKKLNCLFEVTGYNPTFTCEKLSSQESAPGLWDFDVVEIFLKTRSDSEIYYEFILSPLGQFFELEIFIPRKKTNPLFKSGFSKSVQIKNEKWVSEFEIPLEKLNWDGDPSSLKGNAFSILNENPRAYYSLFLPKQEKPDFHLPEYFQSIL